MINSPSRGKRADLERSTCGSGVPAVVSATHTHTFSKQWHTHTKQTNTKRTKRVRGRRTIGQHTVGYAFPS